MATEKSIWIEIRKKYVTSDLSYKQLAQEFDVSAAAVAKHGKNEKWPEKRKKHREFIARKAEEKIAKKEANKLAKLITAADNMAEVINKAMEDSSQFNRFLVTESTIDKNGNIRSRKKEKVFKKLDTKAVRDMTAALKDLTQTIRSLNNIPTPQEEQAMEIARERLEMEKEKQGRANGQFADIKVEMEGELDAWAQ